MAVYFNSSSLARVAAPAAAPEIDGAAAKHRPDVDSAGMTAHFTSNAGRRWP